MLKTNNHKKLQRLLITASLSLLIIILNKPVFTQVNTDLPESLGRSIGTYTINLDRKPKYLKNFSFLRLENIPNQDTDNPPRDVRGRVRILGTLAIDNKSFFFKEAYIRIIVLENEDYYKDVYFKTNKINGEHYQFIGSFLESKIFYRGQYTKLTGELSKYKNNKKIFSRSIPLNQDAEL